MTDELDRLPTDQRQRFLQIPSTISVVCSQGCPNYPKYKFAISLQYLNKELSYEVDFLHADKHESLLQIDSMILMGMVKHSQSSQDSKCAMSLQYLKKEVKDEVDFLHADKDQSFLNVYFNTFGIKVFSTRLILSLLIGMIKHSQITQSNKFAIFLHYLKKKIRMEVIFGMQINVKACTSWYYPF